MDRRLVLGGVLVAALLGVTSLFFRNSGLLTDPVLVARTIGGGHMVRQQAKGTTFQTTIDHFVFDGVVGNLVDNNVYYVGSYEPHVLGFLRHVTTTTDYDGVFLDIGANIGQHSLFMAKYVDEVHAIEPWPVVLERMDAMIAANGIDNIRVHRLGYAAEPGSLPFYAPPDQNLGTGSFDPDFSPNNTLTVHLPLVVGDDHLAGAGVDDVDIVKIDIEGYERFALQGLRKTLDRDRPLVVMELNMTDGGFTTREQMEATFPVDYQWFHLGFGGAFPDGVAAIEGLGYAWVYGPALTMQWDAEPYDYAFDEKFTVVGVPAEAVGALGL